MNLREKYSGSSQDATVSQRNNHIEIMSATEFRDYIGMHLSERYNIYKTKYNEIQSLSKK